MSRRRFEKYPRGIFSDHAHTLCPLQNENHCRRKMFADKGFLLFHVTRAEPQSLRSALLEIWMDRQPSNKSDVFGANTGRMFSNLV